jgi:hypothetical protein
MAVKQRRYKYTEHKPFGRRYLGVTCSQVKARFSIMAVVVYS